MIHNLFGSLTLDSFSPFKVSPSNKFLLTSERRFSLVTLRREKPPTAVSDDLSTSRSSSRTVDALPGIFLLRKAYRKPNPIARQKTSASPWWHPRLFHRQFRCNQMGRHDLERFHRARNGRREFFRRDALCHGRCRNGRLRTVWPFPDRFYPGSASSIVSNARGERQRTSEYPRRCVPFPDAGSCGFQRRWNPQNSRRVSSRSRRI